MSLSSITVGSRGMPVRKRSTRVADSRANAAARVVTIGRPQPHQGRTATPLCTAGGGGWSTRTLLSGQNARAPAPGRPHGARRDGDFSAVADPRLVFGSGAALVHTPGDLAATCCSPGSRNSESDTRPHGCHPLVGSRTAAVASRAGTRPSTLQGYLPAGGRTPPDCQLDHGTFQSPYPSQDGIGVPPVLV